MPQPDDHGPEALRRLDQELKAFETRRAVSPARGGEAKAASDAYRVAASLIGGLLGGLGLGWLFDTLAHTTPFGLIAGLLIGVVASTYTAVRTAGRKSADSPGVSGPAASAPADDEDE